MWSFIPGISTVCPATNKMCIHIDDPFYNGVYCNCDFCNVYIKECMCKDNYEEPRQN